MPGLQAENRLQIVALVDSRPESSSTFARDYGLDVAEYTEHRQMLEIERPDIVVVTLWTNFHLPVFRDCVAAGVKAVLSEKPMAATWGECVEMARIAEESGVLLTFCHQRRFASGNRMVRQLIGEGRFGQIERMDLFAPMHLLDCGTHSLDQAISFNDEIGVRWVHGAVDISDTINWFDVRAEIMASGIFCFENGVHGTIRTGTVDMDFWGGVRVTGSEGFAEVFWDGQIRRAVVYSDPSWSFPVVEEQPEEQMIGMIRNAVDCLESGAEPELSYRKALRVSEALFALYESARRHARITLPLEGVIGNPLHDMLDERIATG